MDRKPRPNHLLYVKALQAMTPAERLEKSFELTENARALFRAGLQRLYPHATSEEIQALYLRRLDKCHNVNY